MQGKYRHELKDHLYKTCDKIKEAVIYFYENRRQKRNVFII